MASPFRIRINDREFTRTLNQYVQYSRRAWPVIANTKAFYIARRAARETPKADKAAIVAELRGRRTKAMTLKSGRIRNTKYNLAQLIVLSRLKKGEASGKKDIAGAVKKLIAARQRAVAFLKSGWLPAIKRLEPLAEKIGRQPPRLERGIVQIGKPKGSARPAKEGARAFSQIINDALSKTKGGFLQKLFGGGNRAKVLAIAEPALQRAFDAETASMREYIEKKLKQAAQRATIRTN